jgi:N-acetylmuramoyl-L-alanine amidase
MANTPIYIPALEERKKFRDYRMDIWGNSYTWDRERSWNEIKYLVIHHTVTNPTNNPKNDIDYIAQLHKNRGWGGVGYHLIIDATGMVWYVGDLSTQRANVANMNDKVIGIAMIGDFTKGNPTDEQIISAHDLCKWFIEDFKAVPSFTKGWDIVVGHKFLQATQCPGTNWKGVPDSIYERIKNRIPYTSAPIPEPEIDWEKRYLEFKKQTESKISELEGQLSTCTSTNNDLGGKIAENQSNCQTEIADLTGKLKDAQKENPEIKTIIDFTFGEFVDAIVTRVKAKLSTK